MFMQNSLLLLEVMSWFGHGSRSSEIPDTSLYHLYHNSSSKSLGYNIPMQIIILTLFPEYFASVLNESILKRAQAKELVHIKVVNIRDFATDKHQVTDDRPFGGGPGMVMKVEPIHRALQSLPPVEKQRIVLTSAKGSLYTQQTAGTYTHLERLVIICGHYEGVDERVAEHLIDEEIRIGDYVLTGGEPAAAVIVDSVTRLVPGVLGNEASNQGESHTQPGVLGYPQYTRPEEYNGWKVPEILLGGDHKKITEWRNDQRRKN
jgi:tRNA (guanine37-N1)-methyltransferase